MTSKEANDHGNQKDLNKQQQKPLSENLSKCYVEKEKSTRFFKN